MTDKDKGSWWASRDGEWFSVGPEDSREGAIKAGAAEFGGKAFEIVQAELHEIKFSAERLIEDQYFDDDDLWHDGGGDRRGNSKAADEELQALLDGWLAKHGNTFITPNAFSWMRNEETIPAGAVSTEISA